MVSALSDEGSTRAWRRIRSYILERDGWRCQVPGPDGALCLAYAGTVDHIVPRALGGTDDPSNLRAACATCNSRAGATVRRPGALVVVIGPPCSGKSTWARDAAAPGDITVDFDDLAVVFGGTRYGRDRLPNRAAAVARAAVVRSLLTRPPTAATAYIVHTAPNVRAVAEYRAANARLVVLDPGKDICLARARAERPPEWAGYIERWYADPPAVAVEDAPAASRW